MRKEGDKRWIWPEIIIGKRPLKGLLWGVSIINSLHDKQRISCSNLAVAIVSVKKGPQPCSPMVCSHPTLQDEYLPY